MSKESKVKANVITTWHRVNYHDIDPKLLRPYIGWRNLKNIKDTLQRTTQMAKMIINKPLRKHLQPRFSPFCNIKRLEELVSTDPMFANCKGLLFGFRGAQIFYCTVSHRIIMYGFILK